MLKIGITGGIGSGKTTVCRIFEVLGIPVFYADAVAKEVMTSDKILVEGVKGAFGDDSYLESGELNRKHLAGIVFNDATELEKLNTLVHPAVFRAFDTWAASVKEAPYLIKEAALLFESGSYRMCDLNVLVTAPEALKIARVSQRDNISAEEVQQRMNKQFSDEKKLTMA
ncbi:MAG TPA: dephospho-CoA kinase, partial [Sphingobacteriaceae bacterium]